MGGRTMIENPQQAARRLAAGLLRDGFKPQALHVYTDLDGKPLHWRVRLKHPDSGEKWIRPMKRNGTGYELGEHEYPDGKPLYRLHVLSQRTDEPVFVCEGENKVDALEKLGILATTSGGATSAEGVDWSPIADREVGIWPDNDEAGSKYADAVAEKLLALGCKVSLIDVSQLELPAKGDAVDWVEKHPEATKADVMALAVIERKVHEWPEPQPLPELPTVPPLPVDILPDALQAWVADAAERAQFPPDFAAAASMVALGSVLGRKLGIRLKARDDWTEYGNIWGGLVGPPSSMKSPAMREALHPLKALQKAADTAHDSAMETHRAEEEHHKLRKQAQRSKAKRELEKEPTAKIDLDPSELDEPVAHTYWTSNVNEASLGVLLQDNPNGLLIERDELSSLLTDLEDDNRADLRGMLLSGWSGKEGYRFDRIGRGVTCIPKCAVSILGGIQPGPLERYVRGAFAGQHADGLLQRFQMLVWPDSVGFKHVDRWPTSDAKKAARELFERVDKMDPLAMGAKDDFGNEPPFVRLSDEAQAIFNKWYVAFMNERRFIDEGGVESGPLAAHFGKYPGLVGKLALIIHVADERNAKSVSERTLRKALGWIDYLTPHARRIYHASDCPETGAAKLLLARIKGGKVTGQFKPRDIYRNGWHGLTDHTSVKRACGILTDHGWLIEAHPKGSNGGRPGDAVYEVSPVVVEKKSQRARLANQRNPGGGL